MNSYLYIKSFLDQEKTIELLGWWSPLSGKDTVKKINNWLKNQSLSSVDQKKELEMTPALEEGPVASTSSKPDPKASKENPKGTQKKKRTIRARAKARQIGTDLTNKGTASPNWRLQPWTVSSIWPGLLWNSQPKSRKG
ncbi:hypothetical protein O181_060080 [Austropuccinia psidii MF-1]|uniref:Uncharacterized protein n=1 Tax=Austropuccinia psidii MF-1 TaxID=1389203 RepID=A0A9Q3ECQ3_9BASI|nr:hypothetical protein [Austropuccinia psidii MF-1]